MPGKIFINETADKQKVELTTGADGVSGGYYDPDGVWHDFGGGGGSAIPTFQGSIGMNNAKQMRDGFTDNPMCSLTDEGLMEYVDITNSASVKVPYTFIEDANIYSLFYFNDMYGAISLTDAVNCALVEIEGTPFISITDPTKDSSGNITATAG